MDLILVQPEQRLILEHYLRGVDPIVTHRALKKLIPYEVFLRTYVDLVLIFHSAPAEHKRTSLTTIGAENLKQLCRVRDLVLASLELCVDEPNVVTGTSPSGDELTADRVKYVAPLASAHCKAVTEIHAIYKQQLEEAAALHSLLASRSEADELDSPLEDPT